MKGAGQGWMVAIHDGWGFRPVSTLDIPCSAWWLLLSIGSLPLVLHTACPGVLPRKAPVDISREAEIA